MKPHNPHAPADERIEDAAQRAATDAEAAELAMHSEHQAFAGAATGVGSVAFDDPGAFGVGARVETPADERGPSADGGGGVS